MVKQDPKKTATVEVKSDSEDSLSEERNIPEVSSLQKVPETEPLVGATFQPIEKRKIYYRTLSLSASSFPHESVTIHSRENPISFKLKEEIFSINPECTEPFHLSYIEPRRVICDYFDDVYSSLSTTFEKDNSTSSQPGSLFSKKDSIIGHYNQFSSVLQVGATCGFVALSMASQVIHPVEAKKLYEEAKKLNLTVIGEMFDSYVMAKFASRQLRCEAKVLHNLYYYQYDMLSHICNGWPVLIAYDNFYGRPGRAGGERAHWAILNGFCFKDDFIVEPDRHLRIISEYKREDVKGRLELLLENNDPADLKIHVLAKEGHAKKLHAWHFDTLLKSNYYLNKCSMKYGLPHDYELENLRDTAVLLKKRE